MEKTLRDMSNEMLRARRSGGFYNNVLFEQRTNAIAKKQFEIFRGLLGRPTPPKATIAPSTPSDSKSPLGFGRSFGASIEPIEPLMTKKSRLFRGKPIPGAPLNGSKGVLDEGVSDSNRQGVSSKHRPPSVVKNPLTEPSEVCTTVGNGNKVCGPPNPRFLGSGVAAAPEPSDDDDEREAIQNRQGVSSKHRPFLVKRENFLRGVSARAGLSRGLSRFRRLMERLPRDLDEGDETPPSDEDQKN